MIAVMLAATASFRRLWAVANHRPFGLDHPQSPTTLAARSVRILLAEPVAAAIAGAPDGHRGGERAGLGPPFAGSALGSALLSPDGDVADPSPTQRAKIGARALACVDRGFVRIASQVGLDDIEQRRELRLIIACCWACAPQCTIYAPADGLGLTELKVDWIHAVADFGFKRQSWKPSTLIAIAKVRSSFWTLIWRYRYAYEFAFIQVYWSGVA
jgi:hypothetical protein